VTPQSDAAIPHGLIKRSSGQAGNFRRGNSLPQFLAQMQLRGSVLRYLHFWSVNLLNSTLVSLNSIGTEAPGASKPTELCTWTCSGFSSQSSVQNSLHATAFPTHVLMGRYFGDPDPEGSPSVRPFEFICRDSSLRSRRIAY
jgi:hypothetical protein